MVHHMNYTPLDIAAMMKDIPKKEQTDSLDFTMIFLGLIFITLVVMAILLFILIQRKIQTLSYAPFFA